MTEIASLEKVQRRATKFILNDFSDISYRDRCIKLSLLPLSFRREIHDLCFLFYCIHGKVNCNFLSNFINLVDISTGRRSTQQGILLKIPRVKSTIFIIRILIGLEKLGIFYLTAFVLPGTLLFLNVR